MFCNKCGQQNTDNANFCSSCGASIQGNPYLQRQSTPNFQTDVPANGELTKAQKAIFIVGLIEVGTIISWKLIGLFGEHIGSSFFKYTRLLNPIELIISVLPLFFCFLFAKKGLFKNVLMVFFILSTLMYLYDFYLKYLIRDFFDAQ